MDVEILMSKVFNVPQSEDPFSPIRVEGENSQENLSHQEADQDQVDVSIMKKLTTASTKLTDFSSCVADFAVIKYNDANILAIPHI